MRYPRPTGYASGPGWWCSDVDVPGRVGETGNIGDLSGRGGRDDLFYVPMRGQRGAGGDINSAREGSIAANGPTGI